MSFWGLIWVSFGVHDAGPGGPKLIFFWSGHRPSAFLPSGGLGGCFWKVFGTTFGYLEVSFVDDFEKARVFVRCTDSTLSLDSLFPCYPYGWWYGTKFCLFRSLACSSN